MIEFINAVLGFFLRIDQAEISNGDGTYKKKRKVSIDHQRVGSLVAIALAVFMLWSLSLIPHTSGFAFAGSTEKAIDEKMKPINEKLSAMDSKVTTQGDALNEVLTAFTAERINATKRQICKSTDVSDRARMNADLNKLLWQYFKYSGGVPYSVPNCGDL